jgi:hypothetical protein
VLLPTSYLAGAPVLAYFVAVYAPSLTPIAKVAYAPLESYIASDLPGSKLYAGYVNWCLESLGMEQ